MRETTTDGADWEHQPVELTLLLTRRQFEALEGAAARRGVSAARLLRLLVRRELAAEAVPATGR